ncbi:MAG: hypothetical protein Q7S31_01240 [bacterium]|nr:hypothetical protein [bacterium]
MTDRLAPNERLKLPLRLLAILSLGLAGCGWKYNENAIYNLDNQCDLGLDQASSTYEIFPGDTLYVGTAEIESDGQGNATVDTDGDFIEDLVGINGVQVIVVAGEKWFGPNRQFTISTQPGEETQSGYVPTRVTIGQECPIP